MKAVLPVAGNGTRLYPLGVDTPKALIPILNKPLLLWSLEALQKNNISEVIVVVGVGKFGTMICDYVKTLKFPNLKIKIAVQQKQLGTANVLQVTQKYFNPKEEFIFMYGDDLYGPKNISKLLTTKGLAVCATKVTDPEKWGIFKKDRGGRLLSVIEKPKKYVGNLANIGCMKLNSEVFDVYNQVPLSSRGEYELTDSLTLLSKKRKITVIEKSDYWIPIGYPWHVLDASNYFLDQIETMIEGKIEPNVMIEGKIILPKTSVIKSGSYIEGNLLVGEHSVIGPNAYIRGNVSIGSHSKIGANVEVKNVVMGDNSTIPHLSYFGDSVIGKRVNSGGQSIVANLRHDGKNVHTMIKNKLEDTTKRKFGTIIGNDVHLGIGTRIYPGRKLWPGTHTIPGQIVDKDITAID